MDELKLCGRCNPDARLRNEQFDHSTGYCLGAVPLGGENPDDITIEVNQDPDCFSIRQPDPDGGESLIHFCDWPAMRATIDAFQAARHPGGRDAS